METLVMSFCFARLDNIREANLCAKEFIASGLDFSETHSGALALVESLQDSNYQNYLNNNFKANIKKLKLSKFI